MENKTGYLPDGQEVEILESTDTGFIVISKWNDGDYGLMPGDYDPEPFFVQTVWDKVPLKKYSDEIVLIKKSISDHQETRNKLVNEINNLRKEHEDAVNISSKYPQLKNLNMFLSGKVTHVVTLSTWRPEIIPIEEMTSRGEKSKLRLISLYGDLSNEWQKKYRDGVVVQWEVSEYSDGSGTKEAVVLCLSYEESQEKLQGFLNKQIPGLLKEKHFPDGIMIAHQEHGIKVCDEWIRKYNAKKEEQELKRHNEKLENYYKLQKELGLDGGV